MTRDLEQSGEFTPPAGCEDCVLQCEIGGRLLMLHAAKEAMNSTAAHMIDDSFEEEVKESMPPDIPEDALSVEDVVQGLKQSAVSSLDEIYLQIKRGEELSAGLARSCVGPLKMRATGKDDVVYTVGVCTSKRAHTLNSDDPKVMPAHVWAQTKISKNN